MFVASFPAADLSTAPAVARVHEPRAQQRGQGAAWTAESCELVEWEMSAGQVGSLVAAMGVLFGLVWLFA